MGSSKLSDNKRTLTVTDKHPILQIISDIASELGIEVYVIGGYVRDLILNRPC